jgi:hypothetical protein
MTWGRFNHDCIRAPISRREIRDCWYAVAKIRERLGDKEGATRARRSARIIGDMRIRK